ncbi:DEAD/DEAH box helicase [Salibacterium salarium]|uniref:ATP-dependent RNA helicase DbpA n=1 Tax=Salibacterium salarium TaxID=284579 RepID=A0A3R9PAD2_9BACI|nr:DEAD/DEAH box helicase [Salibacterium salarium]RSL33955.1 DEAD/DEAH box helicase [Salibacterium salarium]
MESFNDFKVSESIKQALMDLKYNKPTEVQQKVIPFALEKKDLIVKSQTGSGKTASFGIPICELAEWKENKPQALILTPTRELAAQVKEDITNIGRFKRVKAAAIFGKQPFDRQKLELQQKTHVVVGTPGRVFDHIKKGTLFVDQIKHLVIDEADEMLNMGFIDQVEAIIKELPENRITSVFSATIPGDVDRLCYKYMKNPVELEVVGTGVMANNIQHSLVEVHEEYKSSILKDVTVVENPDSCIVFCRTQETVNALCNELQRENYSTKKIHGGLGQDDRFSVMNDFKRGTFRYLVATDVAARGIDIDNISLIINYDIPLEKENYVHRTGRTGRAGKSGKAITLFTPVEEKYVSPIEEYIGFSIPVKTAPTQVDVAKEKAAFNEKMNDPMQEKKAKSDLLNQNIMKLYFNGGKKKKLRPVDFVGTLTSIPDITADDIGIISIQANATYVDILNAKGPLALQEMKNRTIKGKKLKVHEARE